MASILEFLNRSFANSPDVSMTLQMQLVSLLDRNADPGGLEYWRQILAQHGHSAVVAGLMASNEYRIRMGR